MSKLIAATILCKAAYDRHKMNQTTKKPNKIPTEMQSAYVT